MTLKIQSSDIPIQTNEGKKHVLPKDLWFHILSYISPRHEFRHVANAAKICKSFYQHLWKEIQIREHALKGITFLSQIKGVPSCESIPQSNSFDTHVYPFLLMSSSDGRQFFVSNEGPGRGILFILEFSKNKKAFCLSSMDVQKTISDDRGLDESFKTFGQNIIQVHTLTEGLIIVSYGGASLWKWSGEKFEYKSFHSPYKTFDILKRVTNSFYHDGVLYLQYISEPHSNESICKIDLRSDAPLVLPFEFPNINLTNHSCILQFENHFYFFSQTEKQQELAEIFLNTSEMSLRSTFSPRGEKFSFSQNSGNWFLVNSKGRLQVYDLATNTIVLGVEKNIMWSKFDEILTIREDILVITYENRDTRIFYLPAKKELTEMLSPILNKYKHNEALSFFSLAFSEDSTLGQTLTLLFLVTPNRDPSALTRQNLYEVKVYLEKTEDITSKVENNKLLGTWATKALCAKPLAKDSKVYFVVAGIFALIGVVSYFTLKAYVPGSILDRGHGIHLYASELSACIFGVLSLTTVAIGTYRFWKEKQTNKISLS